MTFQLGDLVSIATAGALTSGGALCAAGFHGDVVAVTEKAIKLQDTLDSGKEISAWFPVKAFTTPTERGTFGNQRAVSCTLKAWFKPAGWTATYMRLTTENSTLVAR
jgi:hypothetical protein